MLKTILAASIVTLSVVANAQAAAMHDMKPMHMTMKHKCHKGMMMNKKGKCVTDKHMQMMMMKHK